MNFKITLAVILLFERTNESKIKWWIYSFVYND
jgi:hypothetical protein